MLRAFPAALLLLAFVAGPALAGAIADVDLVSCTSTSRCTGVRVEQTGPWCFEVGLWWADEEDAPTASTSVCP